MDDENSETKFNETKVDTAKFTAAVNAVTLPARIDLPTFIKDNVKLWLVQVEQRLAMYRVTSETSKYNYVSSSLPPEVALRVADFLFAPPEKEPYTSLRDRILREYEDTENARLTKLLEECELGDQKPTVFLRRLRQLANGGVSDGFLLNLFMKRLPEQVRLILAVTGVADLDKAATAADKALEFATGTRNVSVVNTEKPESTISELQQQVAALTEAVKNFATSSTGRRSRSRSRTPAKGRNRSQSRGKQYETCWYHFKFGADAKKCRLPCNKAAGKTSEN